MGTLRIAGLSVAALLCALFATSCGPREKSLADLERVDGVLVFQGRPFTGTLLDHYPGGALKSRSGVRKGRLHGKSEGWFADGGREVEEHFVQGVSHGQRTRWHPGGKIASEATIIDGEITGIFRRWHSNGLLAEEITMVEGRPHGPSKSFRPDGSPLAEVVFEDDRIVSSQYWNADGTPRP